YYKGSIVHFNPGGSENGFLAAGKMAGQDDMEIAVFGNEERILLTARFDNLGKGACGAAIQNMNLVLGVEETTGLVL
ncbi:MAG: N-acetyl-gamma-glutamyl-phosphate reductase, partial [Lachnospiraceae bacterium]|nr:N-acetyl-gamma-glutamyl-phosphate reductase [Lachnospiraceae bacterium]